MIRPVKTYEECRDFVSCFQGDPSFSDPMLSSDEQLQYNLVRPIESPDRYCVFGVYHEETLIGLFAFLVIRDEQYMEMLAGLSHEKSAYLLGHSINNITCHASISISATHNKYYI